MSSRFKPTSQEVTRWTREGIWILDYCKYCTTDPELVKLYFYPSGKRSSIAKKVNEIKGTAILILWYDS